MLMGQKSKTKGSSWERDVANYLSSLYGESFIRVPNSGAYIGGKNAARKQVLHEGQIRAMKGDIIPPLNWNRFNCECKNYADFPFHLLYQGNVKQLDQWLEQLLDVADPLDLNILFFKITRKGKFIAVPASHSWQSTGSYTHYRSDLLGNWKIYDHDDFFNHNKDLVQQLSI